MNLKEIITSHADKFTDIPNADEVVNKVSAVLREIGYNVIIDNTKEPNFIPKSRFDEVITQKNQVKTQADELNQQLEELKKSAKGNEELTKQIEELQKKNLEWEGKYKSTTLEAAIKLSAMAAKAKDPADIIAFVDKTKLELAEDGTVKGLDEQLKGLQESKSYLFEPAGSTKGGDDFSQGGGDDYKGPNPFKPGPDFNLTKQAEMLKNNPVLAEKLMKQK